MLPVNEEGREVVQLAGDMDQGLTSSVLLNRGAVQIVTHYKGRFNLASGYDYLEGRGELYVAGDELMLHVICPSCGHQVALSNKRSQMEYDAIKREISVTPWTCTWEKGRGTDNTADDRMDFGLGLCNARLVIDKNLMRDA